MSDTTKTEADSFFGSSAADKSAELAYLDRVALTGFSVLGVVSVIILGLAIYLSVG